MIAHLTNDQSGLGVITTIIENVDFGLAQFGDQRTIIAFTRIIASFSSLGDTKCIERITELIGEALPISCAIVNYGNISRPENSPQYKLRRMALAHRRGHKPERLSAIRDPYNRDWSRRERFG